MIDYTIDGRGVAILTWNMADRPVNVMNDESLALFAELIERALNDAAVKGLVIASAKRDFVTGADLVSFLSDRRPQVIQHKGRLTQAILRRLESGGKPVCAALAGSALGGGMEIALACHRRIAADNSAIRFGLPEVTLGLLPGAGGTQRLPRLIGVRAALPFLLEGRTVAPAEALQAKIVDEVVEAGQVLERAVDWVATHAGAAVQPWDARGFVLPGGALDPVTTYQVFATETARITARTQNNLPAPRHILSAVFEGSSTDLDTGLRCELRHFVACVCSTASKNIIRTQFFGVTAAAKLKQRPRAVPPLSITRLGVVGRAPGTDALLRAAAKAGLPVSWLDGDAAPAGADEVATLTCVANADDLAGCSLVACAADHPAQAAFAEAIRLGDCTAATGTGAVAIRLAGDSRLLEVLHDPGASDTVVAHAMDLARRIGKVPLLLRGSAGSYVDQVSRAYREAVAALQSEGVAPVLINAAARQAGMAQAPLPPAADDGAVARSTPAQWQQAAQSVERAKARLLVAQAVAALVYLEDGVIASPLDGDIGALLGCGFPLHLGGPFAYVDELGAEAFLRLCEGLVPPAPMDARVRTRLERHARQAERFHVD